MLASLQVLLLFLLGPCTAAVLLCLLSDQPTGAHLHREQLDRNGHQRRLPAPSNHQGDTRCLVNEPLSATVVFPPLPTPSGHQPVVDTTGGSPISPLLHSLNIFLLTPKRMENMNARRAVRLFFPSERVTIVMPNRECERGRARGRVEEFHSHNPSN